MDIGGNSEVRYPPRYWWTKRLALLGVVVFVGLGGLRAWWARYADGLVAADHAAMRAVGDPVSAEDLNAAPVPAERNAAAFMLRAIAVKSKAAWGPQSSSGEFPVYPPFTPAWHQLADGMVAANGPVFPLLRQARAYDQFDWGSRFASPVFNTPLTHLNASRELTNFLTDSALREHVHGNDAAALELIRDALHVARGAGDQPFLISQLVGVGCNVLALQRLHVISAGLTVTDGEDFPAGSPVPRGPATRGQVTALVAELLRPPPPQGRMARALAGERAAAADYMRLATARNPVLRPLFTMEEWRVLADTRWYAAAAAAPDWAGVQQVIRARQAGAAGPPTRGRVASRFSAVVLPSVDRAMFQDTRAETERRLAAVSLAAQLYRADHRGEWPASMGALVPAHLPAVPADPFAPGGAPLKYVLVKGALPFGADRPVAYSVGENGTDEVATGVVPLAPTPQFSWNNGDVDYRRDLTRWHNPPAWAAPLTRWLRRGPAGRSTTAPAAPDGASPEAVDDEPDEADEPGEEGEGQQR